MKKKNLSTRLTLNKKRITTLGENNQLDVKGGAISVNICQLSRKAACEPSWDSLCNACISHLSGCDRCPTWTTCEM
ncbi:class I lanthipeptide [Taibaiella koreensis]|uniref:class I lanthipeptide n=1 Tax=Taibaiella koreensis TaxID=1268548 RepID=UPI0013C2F07A|nr:class I lanthipeptide [Taibaiella koreensis]